jgi:hypothetical protein
LTELTKANGNMVQHCPCAGCAALRQEYKNDPDLLNFYAKKLLVRGWAGRHLSENERLYLSSHSDWYKSQLEKGKRLAAQYLINRPTATPDPVPQEAPGVEADLDTTPPGHLPNRVPPASH